MHLYTPLLFAWCRKAGLQESDIADVCQDVFQDVSSSIDKLEYYDSSHSFRGWLWTITRSRLSKHFYRVNRSPRAGGGSAAAASIAQVPDWIDDEEVPEAASAQAELVRRAADIIKGDFEERTWQAFWLSSVEGMPTAEIGEQLGMASNAVRQAKFRVMARLKEFLL